MSVLTLHSDPSIEHLRPQRPSVRVGVVQSRSTLSVAFERAACAGLIESGHAPRQVEAPHASRASVTHVARELSFHDVAIVQYDCDCARTRSGEALVGVLRAVRVPTIVVLHSVPSHSASDVEGLVVRLCEAASLVVVMSLAARTVLTRMYAVDETKVVVIPWGSSMARVVGRSSVPEHDAAILALGDRGRTGGLDLVVEAMAILRRTAPGVRCIAVSGDSWRGEARGVLMAAASVVVLPLEHADSLVTPALVDSLAAGRPVIAAEHPHARELLSDGAGLVVPQANAQALAEAIRVAATDAVVLAAMTARARLLAPSLSWRVARRGIASCCERLSVRAERMAA